MRFKRPLIVTAVALLPLLVGATSPQFTEAIRTFAVSATRPILDTQGRIGRFLRTEINQVLEWPRLRKENENLRAELVDLKAKLVGLEELKHHAEHLETLLKLEDGIQEKTIAARVIGRDPSHWSQFIVINKGSQEGVDKNTVLIHPDGLVGKVVASGSHSARAILLPDSESRVSAMNQRTRDVGLIEGTGSPLLKMTYLDRQADVQIDDVIISSGVGGIYPKGIPIGKIEMVAEEKDRLSLYAIVRPFVSFAKLEEVLCVSSQARD